MKKKLLSFFLGMWIAASCLPMTSAAAEDPSKKGDPLSISPSEALIQDAGDFKSAPTPKGEHAERNAAPTSFLLGDVDGNGTVDARDRRLLNRLLRGLEQDDGTINWAAADIDRNTRIDLKDAAILARYLANWEGYDEIFHPTFPDIDLSAEAVYQKMVALKGEYYEGRPWTNNDYYEFKHFPPFPVYGGYGCVAFAFILSDAAFGELPARQIDKGGFTYADLRPGDILRMDGNAHSVIILRVESTYIEIAEGNFNSSIHWGRTIDKETVMNTTDYMITRYPNN